MAKLHFYYSTMNAGKSTVMLQSSYNYQERGMQTLLFSPLVDDRYGKGKVASRIGLQADAINVDNNFDIYAYVKQYINEQGKIACVLIDEAQFLSIDHIRQLCKICDQLNIPVLAYGLRTDFLGEPFPASIYLLAWADILIELKTICHCGKKATMNHRIDADGRRVKEGKQIEIGGNERYVTTCRKHFYADIG